MVKLAYEQPLLVAVICWLLLGASLTGLILLGIRFSRGAPKVADTPRGIAAVEGTVFAILGLLLAFTFAGASERFAKRKVLVLTETQAAGTAWDRLDLLPEAPRADLQARFRAYIDRRIECFRNRGNETFLPLMDQAAKQGRELAAAARAACRTPAGQPFAVVVLTPIDEMLDVALARRAAHEDHPPAELFMLLFGLALGAALLVGLAMGTDVHRSWVHILAFAAVVGATIYLTLELELPRLGLIRVEASDQLLIDLREEMG